jgi:hypothetical protein
MQNSLLMLLLSITALWGTAVHATQKDLYSIDSIQKIEIYFHQSNWDYMMDTAKIGLDGYILSDSVVINGKSMDSVGVKYKGNSSFNSLRTKNPLTISLDEFKDNKYKTYKTLKLSNCYQDPSMIREVLAYNILAKYMYCPQANFAQVYVNGAYYGVYSNIENINKQFCATHFNTGENTLIKCNPSNVVAANKSNLKYITTDSIDYEQRYEIKSNYGWHDLVTLCDSLTNAPSKLTSFFNIDRVLWMLAFDNVLVNLDSYIGLYSQNYFINKDATGKYNPIVWDLNMSFGGFRDVGSGKSNSNILTNQTSIAKLTPLLHNNDSYWPLIKAVMIDTSLSKQYFSHIRTIVSENFVDGSYEVLAAKLQATIDTAVASDTTKFFTYSDFKKGMTDSVSGGYYIYGIKSLMDARVDFLKTNIDYIKIPPVISMVKASQTNDSIIFTAKVSNELLVNLGVRANVFDSFSKYTMHDDGLLGDSIANDSIFTMKVPIQSMAVAQYFVYAENDDACQFSPVRAEHEFYSFQTNIPIATKGQVVINELMASNKSTAKDETGAYADWVELYNTTSKPLNLSGLFLSDDATTLSKFVFPQNTIIDPNAYLVIWLDGSSSTSSSLHGNFKLSASGDNIYLSNSNNELLDSVVFNQQTIDVSFGRYPNGMGNFMFMRTPTFDAENTNKTGLEIKYEKLQFSCFPNPAKSYLEIECKTYPQKVSIYDILGTVVFEENLVSSITVDVTEWSQGVYFAKGGNDAVKLIIAR